MKTLGERIRELREEKDLSLRVLATRVGVSAAFLSDVELGRRQPSDKHLAAIAFELGTTLEDLNTYDTRPPLQQFRQLTAANPEYGFAFRRIMEQRVTPRELLEFLDRREEETADEEQ